MRPILSLLFLLVSFLPAHADQAPALHPGFSSKATAKAEATPSIMLNSSTASPSIDSIFGQRQGKTQWRLGLGGNNEFFQVERWRGGAKVDNPFVINNATGQITMTGSDARILDQGRTSQNDNRPALEIESTEAVGYPHYVTNFGVIINRHQLPGGKGDRIALAAVQICDAMLTGQSCVASAPLAVAGGSGQGNYTGSNPRVLVPPGISGGGNAIGQEINTETHSPVRLKYGLLIGDLNQNGPNNATTAGSTIDTAIMIATQPMGGFLTGFDCTTCGHTNGITFGEAAAGYPQTFSIRPGGTLIQASHPSRVLNYGLDLTGMGGGFHYGALAMPINTPKNGIVWGYNRAGGIITSTAVSQGQQVTLTDNGIFVQDSGGTPILGIWNDGRLQTPLSTPASSTAACTAGQFMNDANYHYVCVATNTWKRAALSSF